MEKTYVIIDGHAIIHRAYHALPPLTNKDGIMVNAVFGFSSMLLKVLSDIHPEYISVCFDVGGETFRDELYSEYKATREKSDQELYDQIPLVYDVVKAFNIPIFEKEGFEADDIIGTLAKQIESVAENIKVIIVTGDQDLLQLVNERVHVYLLKKGVSDFTLYNETAVQEKFGFSPKQVVDYKALRGDTSDNIPGVKGIGEKTAKQLIEQFSSIDDLYKEIETGHTTNLTPAVLKKVREGKEDAVLSKQLAQIRTDVPGVNISLSEASAHNVQGDRVEHMFASLSFFSLMKRIPGRKNMPIKKKNEKNVAVQHITKETVEECIQHIQKSAYIACEIYMSQNDIFNSEIMGILFVTKEKQCYIDYGLIEAEQEHIKKIFQQTDAHIIGHDIKKLVKICITKNIKIQRKVFDVMIASYILNAETRSHDSRSIILRELGQDMPEQASQTSLFGINPHEKAQELLALLEVHERYEQKLKQTQQDTLFFTIEMPLIFVLADMEVRGITVDKQLLAELSKEAAASLQQSSSAIYKEAGKEFNIASTVQLREVLFDDLQLPTEHIKKGKTGYSTAASELEKLKSLHPIISLIEDFREIEKLRNTYIDTLPALINKKTKRIHTTYNQAVAATGRLSSSDPNLQNIPIRTELGKKIRNAFIADSGYTLVSIDYSQIELRIVASLSNDTTMIDIFKSGEDIHSATASLIHDVPLEDVTPAMRRSAKAINFGVLYGMGSFGLSSRTEMSPYEAKQFIEKYFDRFSGIKKYIEQTVIDSTKKGYVETVFGRRRYLPELKSKNIQIKKAAERMAVNMPAQGTQADMIKLAMINIYNWVHENGYQNEVKMLLQVHDELVFEITSAIAHARAKELAKIMEQVISLNVPIVADIHVGNSWGDLK